MKDDDPAQAGFFLPAANRPRRRSSAPILPRYNPPFTPWFIRRN
jgi:hypothetical protein